MSAIFFHEARTQGKNIQRITNKKFINYESSLAHFNRSGLSERKK
jgi:hypothetical protein